MHKDNSKFKKLLKEKDLTLKEFATKAGLTSRSLEPYMAGKKSFDNARTWMSVKVADTLGTDIHNILDNDTAEGDN